MRTLRQNYGLNDAATVPKLKIIMVNSRGEKCAYKKFYGKITDNNKYFKTFGEMGFVLA